MKKLFAMILCLAVMVCTVSSLGVSAYADDTVVTLSEEAVDSQPEEEIVQESESEEIGEETHEEAEESSEKETVGEQSQKEESTPENENEKTEESSEKEMSKTASYFGALSVMLLKGMHDILAGPVWLVASPILTLGTFWIPYFGWFTTGLGAAGLVYGPAMFAEGVCEILLAPIIGFLV